VSDIFPSYANAALEDQRIYVNENHTSYIYRRKLFSKAIKKRKNNLIVSAWTIDGKLFIKTSPDRESVWIYWESDLEDL